MRESDNRQERNWRVVCSYRARILPTINVKARDHKLAIRTAKARMSEIDFAAAMNGDFTVTPV